MIMYRLEQWKDNNWLVLTEASDLVHLEIVVCEIQDRWRDIPLRILYEKHDEDWRVWAEYPAEGTRYAVQYSDQSVQLFASEEEARAVAKKTTKASYFGSVAY